MPFVNLFDEMTDAVLIVTKDGEISYRNNSAIEMIGGESIDEFESIHLARVLTELLAGNIEPPLKVYIRRGVEVRVSALKNGYLLLGKDITSSKQYETLKQNFFSLLNNELRIPIQNFVDKISLVSEQLSNLDCGQVTIENAVKNTQKSSREIQYKMDRLLLLCELYGEHKIVTDERILPAELMHDVREMVASQINEKELLVTIITKDIDGAVLYGSNVWLSLALRECLSRMIDQCSQGSTIYLKLVQHAYFLTVVIQNYGLGGAPQIDDENVAPSLLDETSSFCVDHNLDIGLSIANMIVEFHGGSLKVAEGLDDTTIIELPIGDARILFKDELGIEQTKRYADDISTMMERGYVMSSSDSVATTSESDNVK
ncbi:MAG: hypothetical protein HRT93_01435 [Piscirickettsiaceae bacterium]|nr:hypothetical protein [Piscirickettsiaceae bacterium]